VEGGFKRSVVTLNVSREGSDGAVRCHCFSERKGGGNQPLVGRSPEAPGPSREQPAEEEAKNNRHRNAPGKDKSLSSQHSR